MKQYAPRAVPRVRWYQKINPLWALFGNHDDGIYGYGKKDWRPPIPKYPSITLDLFDWPWARVYWLPITRTEQCKSWRAMWWWLRNPFHNLTFYVFGIADRDRTVRGAYPDHTFRPGGGWLFAWNWILPFVSYQSKRWQFYIGWRPTSGALGFTFRRNHDALSR